MNRFLLKFSVVLLSVLMSICQVEAADYFPFLGEITANDVNVRAGQNTNFERLSQLNQNDEVVVLAEQYGWYKIRIPRVALAYVSAEYITMDSLSSGEVNTDRLNVRAGKGTEYSVIGQLHKNDRVQVLEHSEEWLRIEPVKQLNGWVNADLVKFKNYIVDADTRDVNLSVETMAEHLTRTEQLIAQQRSAMIEDFGLDVDEADSENEDSGSSAAQNVSGLITDELFMDESVDASVQEADQLSFLGRLQFAQKDGRQWFQLNVSDTVSYVVEGPDAILNQYTNAKVRIEGKYQTNYSDRSQPKVTVRKIQLAI